MSGYVDSINWQANGIDPAMASKVLAVAQGQNQTGIAGTMVDATGAGVVQPGVVGAGQAGGITPQLNNWQKAGVVFDAIGTIGGLWGAVQQNKIAKQQLALAKESYNQNMDNSIMSYNTALADRANARYIMQGNPDGAAAYIEENKLRRT